MIHIKKLCGIIFCDQYVINHSEKIGDDCIFINNPYATFPVEDFFSAFLKRWHAEKDWKITRVY